MPPSPGSDTNAMMMTLAQDAIAASRALAEQMHGVDLRLQKISSTQDSIAERMVDGKEKMSEHAKRLADLESSRVKQAAHDEHGRRINDLETDRIKVEVAGKTLRLVAWGIAGLFVSGWGAFVTLVGLAMRYYGH